MREPKSAKTPLGENNETNKIPTSGSGAQRQSATGYRKNRYESKSYVQINLFDYDICFFSVDLLLNLQHRKQPNKLPPQPSRWRYVHPRNCYWDYLIIYAQNGDIRQMICLMIK